MFGLFEAPQTKRQKRSAKAAQALREQAFRDAVIELHILDTWQRQARRVQPVLRDLGYNEEADRMFAAINAAQETFDRTGRFSDAFAFTLADLRQRAANAQDFEAVATFELEGRDVMLKVRDEAKQHMSALGTMTIEARERIGELPTRA